MFLLSRHAGNNIAAWFYYVTRVSIAPMLEDSWLTALVSRMEKEFWLTVNTRVPVAETSTGLLPVTAWAVVSG